MSRDGAVFRDLPVTAPGGGRDTFVTERRTLVAWSATHRIVTELHRRMCVHRRALERILVRLSLVVCALAFGALAPNGARAASGPPGFVVEPAFPGSTYQLPVQIAFMPDGRKLVV